MPAAKSDWGVAPTPASPERWRTLLPQLDLADSPILPRAPDAGAGGTAGRSDRARGGQDAGAGAGQRARDDPGRHPHRRRARHRGRGDRRMPTSASSLVRQEEVARGPAGRAGGDAARTRRRSAAEVSWEFDQPHHGAARIRRRAGGGRRPRAGRGAGVAHAAQHRADAVQQARCAAGTGGRAGGVGGGAGLVRGLHRGAADTPARGDGAAGGGAATCGRSSRWPRR